MSLKEKVLATMKSRDTESDFELYVTRTPGYLWALLFQTLHVHPIAVTLMSIVIGAAAGYFFYFDDLRMNLIGMALLVWANWYDCADGQLARMTGKKTLIGRILDGFAGDVWFQFIYVAIALRLTPWFASIGGWPCVVAGWLFGAYAGYWCHVRQANLADYYRNQHLYFQLGRGRSELDRSRQLVVRYDNLRWQSSDWFEKLYLFFYIRYTLRQEHMTPRCQEMLDKIQATYGEDIPESTFDVSEEEFTEVMDVINRARKNAVKSNGRKKGQKVPHRTQEAVENYVKGITEKTYIHTDGAKIAIYRNQSYFLGSVKSAKRFARLVSLTQSAKNCKRNVQKYFHDILNRVVVTVKDELVGILPHKWVEPVTIPLIY